MVEKIKLMLILLITSLSVFAQNTSCDTVDLRPGFGPVNDQQDIGWCYAYTAADLVNYLFSDSLKGRRISPFHLALLYNANEEKHFISEAGNTKVAIQLALAPRRDNTSVFNKGICYQTVDEMIFEKSEQISVREFYRQLNKAFNLYHAYLKSKSSQDFAIFSNYYLEIGMKGSIVTRIAPAQLTQLFQNSNSRDLGIRFMDLFCPQQERFEATGYRFPVSLRMGGIKTILPKAGPSIQIPIDRPEILIQDLKDLLEKSKIPVGIGFHYRFLRENHPAPGGDLHAAIVVGKEKLNNSCHFIIRNSWGDCPTNSSEYQYSKNITKCEKGYLWIKESILTKHLNSIEYIKL